ncbi:MAG TPA: hypothetical protein VL574_09365, partial [Stellaceae bacterium]|nr:hypothetical protein [Stellaceae bacterium]
HPGCRFFAAPRLPSVGVSTRPTANRSHGSRSRLVRVARLYHYLSTGAQGDESTGKLFSIRFGGCGEITMMSGRIDLKSES